MWEPGPGHWEPVRGAGVCARGGPETVSLASDLMISSPSPGGDRLIKGP